MTRVLEIGASMGDAALAVILIHGRGRTPGEMADLANEFDIPNAVFLCPEAIGNSWYPKSFLEPLDDNQPALGSSLHLLDELVQGLLAEGFSEREIVLGGFSQGACLVAQTLLRKPLAYGGAMIFTGGLIGPPGCVWRVPGALPSVPVLLTGSESDEFVPAWRTRETADVLTGLGAEVDMVIYDEREHLVCEDEIDRARTMLGNLAGSGRYGRASARA